MNVTLEQRHNHDDNIEKLNKLLEENEKEINLYKDDLEQQRLYLYYRSIYQCGIKMEEIRKAVMIDVTNLNIPGKTSVEELFKMEDVQRILANYKNKYSEISKMCLTTLQTICELKLFLLHRLMNEEMLKRKLLNNNFEFQLLKIIKQSESGYFYFEEELDDGRIVKNLYKYDAFIAFTKSDFYEVYKILYEYYTTKQVLLTRIKLEMFNDDVDKLSRLNDVEVEHLERFFNNDKMLNYHGLNLHFYVNHDILDELDYPRLDNKAPLDPGLPHEEASVCCIF